MVGVEVYDVLLLGVVLLDIAEEGGDVSICFAQTLPKLLLIDEQLRQTDARHVRIRLEKPLCEGQMGFQ